MSKRVVLSRDALLARLRERPIVEKDVPGLGVVMMREMSVGEREALTKRAFGSDGKITISGADWGLQVVAGSLCDESGARILTADDLGEMRDASQVKLEPLLKEANQLNGLAANSVEEAEKNSESDPAAGSSSD